MTAQRHAPTTDDDDETRLLQPAYLGHDQDGREVRCTAAASADGSTATIALESEPLRHDDTPTRLLITGPASEAAGLAKSVLGLLGHEQPAPRTSPHERLLLTVREIARHEHVSLTPCPGGWLLAERLRNDGTAHAGVLIHESDVAACTEEPDAWAAELRADLARARRDLEHAARPPCPNDTDGDGNCGRPLCPHCKPAPSKRMERAIPTTDSAGGTNEGEQRAEAG